MTRGVKLFLTTYLQFLGMVAVAALIVAIGIWTGFSPVRIRSLVEDFFISILGITGLFCVVGSAALGLKWRDRLRARGAAGVSSPIAGPDPDPLDEPPGQV